jgi:hypothetical protein
MVAQQDQGACMGQREASVSKQAGRQQQQQRVVLVVVLSRQLVPSAPLCQWASAGSRLCRRFNRLETMCKQL